ncbi:MAG: galactonate dehydratase [Anaerolineae bacterium]
MKIVKLETFQVKPRWLFLKITTDDGLVGWGEPIVEGRTRTVETAVHELGEYLVGQDPRLINHHWQAMYRGAFYRGGPVLTSAISGVEEALWDITGKALGVPVYQLLGGACRERIRVYAHVGGNTPEEIGASARAKRALGFEAFKTGFFGALRIVETPSVLREATARLAAMREAVGWEMDIAVDFHGRVSPAMAVQAAKAFEPFGLMFIEEPCLPENVDTMVTIARSTSIPVATGERLFTKWGFREVLEKQAAVILQPDVSHCGGIFETVKIGAMAETYYAAMAPHCPLGPIALAACLQADAVLPNFLIQEQVTLGDDYLVNPFKVVDGHIALPTAPGLGIEVNEEAVRAGIYDGAWQTPQLRHKDGSVADW